MKESKIFINQNLSEKVHYVYRVTIDGKYYIGKRSGSLNDLATGAYATSSKIIQEKLKNGYHFSKIKILKVFSTLEEALKFEERILTRVDAKRNPKFLNQTNGDKNFYNKQHTQKAKEKISKIQRNLWNENTEQGRKRRKEKSEIQRNNWDENTEQGRKLREHFSEIQRNNWDKNTEEGRKRSKNHSEFMKENGKIIAQKRVETNLQNRKNASILGELMFDEDFIRKNFLILDDKNNQRFLWSVYSKLTGFSESYIKVLKREGKLSFLYGIKSISLTEELDNSKIREIECSLKEA